jgi:NDP-sugar pyrophosphorylase family protein
MKGFILAGGLGTRLRPLTYEIPKTMIPIKGKPVLQYNIELLKRYGIKEIVLGIGYMGEKIKEYFGDGKKFGVKIHYSEEKEPLGTAGALKLAGRFFKSTFVMCNGDELKNINIKRMVEFHKKHKPLATISLTKIDNPSEWGVVRMEDKKIVEFVEKPKNNPPSHFINSGLYIMEPEVINMIPNGNVSIEKNIFPILAKKGELFGYFSRGQWFPTDTKERLDKAVKYWKGF